MPDPQVQSTSEQRAQSEDNAVESLNEARRAVQTAITDVRRTSRRFKAGESWQARSAAMFVDIVRTSVRAAPLTMVTAAFVAGAVLFSGRRD
jgi:signal transduction histidine kinase